MKYLFALMLIMSVGFLVAESAIPCTWLCPRTYAPVCSTSHRTYCNLCRLVCAGAVFAHKGVCGCL
uniref:Protease inhibitor4 n=1 Tax=Samia ricini TaxID=63990 RepID=A0A0M4UR90_SAMRI|nr:protease inhibitor4 [Samia ricini]